MSQILMISDTLYEQLETTASARGLNSIEELLQQVIDELQRRHEVVQRVDALRERLWAMYGEMEDSVEIVRADRER